MGAMTKSVKVSDPVKEKLLKIKTRNGHSSIDSVVRDLLRRAGEEL